jgi:catecholate siderophore receptor
MWNLLDDGLFLRATVFRSEKTNERKHRSARDRRVPALRRRRTDGVRARGQPAASPTIVGTCFAAVALMDGEVLEAIDASQEGKEPINTPDYTASFWTSYRLGYGFRIGAGATAVGERYTSLANTTRLPGYVRWDARRLRSSVPPTRCSSTCTTCSTRPTTMACTPRTPSRARRPRHQLTVRWKF